MIRYKVSAKAIVICTLLGALTLIITFCSVYGETKYSGIWYYADDDKGTGGNPKLCFSTMIEGTLILRMKMDEEQVYDNSSMSDFGKTHYLRGGYLTFEDLEPIDGNDFSSDRPTKKYFTKDKSESWSDYYITKLATQTIKDQYRWEQLYYMQNKAHNEQCFFKGTFDKRLYLDDDNAKIKKYNKYHFFVEFAYRVYRNGEGNLYIFQDHTEKVYSKCKLDIRLDENYDIYKLKIIGE